METERCQKGMTVAYAAHCQQEAALDRWVWRTMGQTLVTITVTIFTVLNSENTLSIVRY